MPNTLGEIKDEILVELGTSTTVGYYTDTMLNNWIDRAHIWAAGYKKWPYTEGRVSTTSASLVTDEDGNKRGEYPEGWKSDSIRQMKIGGKHIQKLNYLDFYKELEDYPNNTGERTRLYTDFNRNYFIHPNIDVSGTIAVWGQYTPANLDSTNPDSQTVFSSTEEGNEAIVEKVLSYAMIKEKKKEDAMSHHSAAQSILSELCKDIKAEGYGYQTKRRMFKTFDVLGEGNSSIKEDQFY